MRMQRLGSQGPEISAIGFGAWEVGGMWGPNPSETEILRTMRAAFDGGMTWIDTAEVYGRGYSEELVGAALKGHDDVQVFTKVAPAPAGSGFGAASVATACVASIKRLGRDVIDLYQLHWPDASIEVERTWEAMAALVDEGLVRRIGVSNFNRELIERCEAIRHVDSLQPQFSMLHRARREDLFPFCRDNGTGIIAYGPLAYGLLTGAIGADTPFPDDDWRAGKMGMRAYDELFAPDVRPRRIAVVEALKPVADRLGVSRAQLALAWCVQQVGVTGAIVGSRNHRHTADNAKAGDVVLGEKDLEEIEQILAAG